MFFHVVFHVLYLFVACSCSCLWPHDISPKALPDELWRHSHRRLDIESTPFLGQFGCLCEGWRNLRNPWWDVKISQFSLLQLQGIKHKKKGENFRSHPWWLRMIDSDWSFDSDCMMFQYFLWLLPQATAWHPTPIQTAWLPEAKHCRLWSNCEAIGWLNADSLLKPCFEKPFFVFSSIQLCWKTRWKTDVFSALFTFSTRSGQGPVAGTAFAENYPGRFPYPPFSEVFKKFHRMVCPDPVPMPAGYVRSNVTGFLECVQCWEKSMQNRWTNPWKLPKLSSNSINPAIPTFPILSSQRHWCDILFLEKISHHHIITSSHPHAPHMRHMMDWGTRILGQCKSAAEIHEITRCRKIRN